MAGERYAEVLEILRRDLRHLVHAGVAGATEVLRVPFHLDARQPVLDPSQLGQVRHVGVQELAGSENRAGVSKRVCK